jgi:hypothetical protein
MEWALTIVLNSEYRTFDVDHASSMDIWHLIHRGTIDIELSSQLF